MEVSAKELNIGFQALRRLSMVPLMREQHKLVYKLGRILKSAQPEIDAIGTHLNELMAAYGVNVPDNERDPKKVTEYNKAANDFLSTTKVNLWGDPFKVDEILGVLAISGEDYSALEGWLIVGELTEESEPKAKEASA